MSLPSARRNNGCFSPAPFLPADVGEIERFLSTFSSCSSGVVRAAQGLLSGEEAPKRCRLLADLIQNLNENISAESRKEDETWFEGQF